MKHRDSTHQKKNQKETRDNQLSSEMRYQLRQEKSIPILTALKKWLDHYLQKTSEQGVIDKAIRYCLSH